MRFLSAQFDLPLGNTFISIKLVVPPPWVFNVTNWYTFLYIYRKKERKKGRKEGRLKERKEKEARKDVF